MKKFTIPAIVISSAFSVSASNVVAQNEEDNLQETTIVTGTPIRDSQVAAIEVKRNSNNIVDVIASDTIGRFPDQNLADSLGRIPGMAIERDQGQARFINFRGAPFQYTKIAFDGIDVLGAEDGRTPRFDAFPSVITSQVDVNKAITPDMPGEATVGYINIQTFKPFDKEGLSFSLEAGKGKQELGDVDIDKLNGRLSFSNDVFGAVVFGSHNLRGRITDNREYEYDANDDVINLDFRSYRGDREDNAYGGRIEFKPTENHSIFVSTLYSEFIDREERNQFDFDFEDTPVALGSEEYLPVIVVTRLLEDGLYENSTDTSTLGYDGSVGDWTLEGRLNYTETQNTALLPIPFSAGGVVGGTVNVSDIQNPGLFLTQPGQPDTSIDVNTLDYAVNFGLIFANNIETEATKAKFDLSRPVQFIGTETDIKFGFQYDTREAEGGDTLVFGGFPAEVNVNDFVTDKAWSSDFNNTIGGRDFDNAGLDNAWGAAVGDRTPQFDEDSLISIEEDVLALYAMATSQFDWGSLVYGARVEQTDFTSSGTLLDDEGVTTPVEADNDYTNVLPSIHANINLSESTKVRLSASTGLSRPTYDQVRASQSVDAISLEVSGGNPTLDPEESIGVDLSLEWYFADASLFSVATYYRQIDNVIYPGTSTVDGSLFAPGLIPEGTETTFNSFFNGEDGSMNGLEFNFLGTAEDLLPGALGGFGMNLNVTFIDSEFTAPLLDNQKFSLPGTSEEIYNASVFYERYGLSARINYQYRDDWLSTTENDSLTEFWAETERVDASIRYSIPQKVLGTKVTLALDGNNLTDERDIRFVNSINTPNQVEGFGRRYTFSVRVDY